MKVLLVTSELTYMPRNYQAAFEAVLDDASSHIAGLFIVKSSSLDPFKEMMNLTLSGCRELPVSLARNLVALPLQRRETLFQKRGIPVFQIANINTSSVINWVKKNQIDLIVNIGMRCRYDKELLQAPRMGCLNVHQGVLPRYRGKFSDFTAFLEGRSPGFSIHVMTESPEDGRILFRQENPLDKWGKDYIRYLASVSRQEGKALALLLNQIARAQKLPAGIPNRGMEVLYAQVPKFQEIRQLKKMGMIL